MCYVYVYSTHSLNIEITNRRVAVSVSRVEVTGATVDMGSSEAQDWTVTCSADESYPKPTLDWRYTGQGNHWNDFENTYMVSARSRKVQNTKMITTN